MSTRASVIESAIDALTNVSPSRQDLLPQVRKITVARAISVASILLLAGALLQFGLIYFAGDAWWLATILMFAPRWPLLVPLAFVTCACLLWNRRLLWFNAITAVVIVWPTMGWSAPKHQAASRPVSHQLRIMSLNAGGGTKLDRLPAELSRMAPDVVAIQETPTRLPEDLFDASWHVARARGLTIASRFPILSTSTAPGDPVGRWIDLGLCARLDAPFGEVSVCCVYMQSPRNGFENLHITHRGLVGVDSVRWNTDQRNAQSKYLSSWVKAVKGPKITAGDFNQPSESRFFRRDWSSFQDAFVSAGSGYGYTWLSSWHGIRIDRVLLDDAWHVSEFRIGNSIGGDHVPIFACLDVISL